MKRLGALLRNYRRVTSLHWRAYRAKRTVGEQLGHEVASKMRHRLTTSFEELERAALAKFDEGK